MPAVVAVLVTTDPGPWFEAALSSLASQDYQELSVLVLATGDDTPEVTERVARKPSAQASARRLVTENGGSASALSW